MLITSTLSASNGAFMTGSVVLTGSLLVGADDGSSPYSLLVSGTTPPGTGDALFRVNANNASSDPGFDIIDVGGLTYVGINTPAGTYPLSADLGGGNARFTNGNLLWSQNTLGIRLGTVGSANSTSQSITSLSSSIAADSGILIKGGKSGPDEGHGIIISGSSNSRPLRVKSHELDNILFISGSGLVMFNSGSNSSPSSPDEALYTDINFFISGSSGSLGTTTRGTALFGGDVVISGALGGGSPLPILTDLNITTNQIYATPTQADISGEGSVGAQFFIDANSGSYQWFEITNAAGNPNPGLFYIYNMKPGTAYHINFINSDSINNQTISSVEASFDASGTNVFTLGNSSLFTTITKNTVKYIEIHTFNDAQSANSINNGFITTVVPVD